MKLRWPINRAVGVTIRFRSGHLMRFTCDQITVRAADTGQLVGYKWQGARGAPLYMDPSSIESVRTYRMIRWRGWEPEPVTPAVVDAEANAAVGEPINVEGSDGGPLPESRKVH